MLSVERGSFSLVSVSSASLVILKAISGGEQLKFYALVAQTLPRLVRVNEGELFETGEPSERTELMRAAFADQLVSVPDVDFVEAAIKTVVSTIDMD
jgi:hypothetical protein